MAHVDLSLLDKRDILHETFQPSHKFLKLAIYIHTF